MWARSSGRSGLRVRGERAEPAVRASAIRFAAWLRCYYDFPIRLPVYLLPCETVLTCHGERVSASFFAPWKPDVEPFIRVATGDYARVKRQVGRDKALAGILTSISHEIIHYQQWIDSGKTSERGVAKRARGIVDAYASHVLHP